MNLRIGKIVISITVDRELVAPNYVSDLNRRITRRFKRQFTSTGNKIQDIKSFRSYYSLRAGKTPTLRVAKEFVERNYEYRIDWGKE